MSIQTEIDRIAGAKTTLGNYLQQNGVAVPQGATLDSMALLLADVIEKQNKITASGILKGDGEGGVSAAVAGTDYLKTAPVTSVAGKTGAVTLAKADVGLGSVDNVSINSRLNRTTNVNAADTNYTTYMARGEALFSAETTPTVNGTIAWQYE
jgi:hypothetical protein|nr:MAG TPA: hypothetical protein [Caudoviricetes sp.]